MMILKKKRYIEEIYLNLQQGPETTQVIPTDYFFLIPSQVWLNINQWKEKKTKPNQKNPALFTLKR